MGVCGNVCCVTAVVKNSGFFALFVCPFRYGICWLSFTQLICVSILRISLFIAFTFIIILLIIISIHIIYQINIETSYFKVIYLYLI